VRKRIRAFAWASVVLWLAACDGGAQSSTDGKTSWLQPCSATTDCGGGFQCLCGFCTEVCSQLSECQDLGATAVCGGPDALQGVCGSDFDTGGLCVAKCGATSDCASGTSCRGGMCLPGAGDGGGGDTRTDGSPSRRDPDGATPLARDAATGAGGAAPGSTGDGSSGAGGDADRDSGSKKPAIPDAGSSSEGDATVPCLDDDSDGVCNVVDLCPGHDDHADADGDGRPDGCEPALLRDVNDATAASEPAFFADLGDQIYFTASSSRSGAREIWNVPSGGGRATPVTAFNTDTRRMDPGFLATVQNRLFFLATDLFANTGGATSLWVTDGATNPTQVATGFGLGTGTVAVAGGQFFFTSFDGGVYSLLCSDGTPEGTRTVSSFVGTSRTSNAPVLLSVGNLVFFQGKMEGVWRTDGTPEGTFAVTSERLYAGPGPDQMAAAGGRVYFIIGTDTGTGVTQRSVWTSDGTVDGTRPLVANPPPDFRPWNLAVSGTELSVQTYDVALELAGPNWRMRRDGTDLRVDDTATGVGVPVGDGMYFHTTHGIQWRDASGNVTQVYQGPSTDGALSRLVPGTTGAYFVKTTSTGTFLSHIDASGVTDVTTTGVTFDFPAEYYPGHWAVLGDRLIFAGGTLAQGLEPWVSDGTVAGTHTLDDVDTETLDSNAGTFSAGSPVIFSANTTATGTEPWITFGDANTTALLEDTNPGVGDGFVSTWLARDDFQFVVAKDASGKTLLRRIDSRGRIVAVALDGIEAPSGSPASSAGDRILFGSTHWLLSVPWADLSSPSPSLKAASYVVGDTLNVGAPSALPIDWKGVLWFVTQEPDGSRLWRTDGTNAGTHIVADPAYGSVVPLGESLFFIGDAGGHAEIRRTDSLGARTDPVTDLASSGLSMGRLLQTPFKGYVYFGASSGQGFTFPLYRTNGNGFEAFSGIDAVGDPVIVGDRMFLVDRAHDLWVTDGTTDGTSKLISALYSLGSPHPLAAYHNLVYFTGDDQAHGSELWRTDGTTAGTFMEADLNPGPPSSDPQNIYPSADALYFSASVPPYGNEPWILRH
jgi:ELWxxDGT repeat protein